MTSEKLKALEQLNELQFSEAEKEKMLGLFERMYTREAVMHEFPTDKLDVMVHVMPMTNILREDKREQNFSRDSLLDGAPEHTGDSWQVPRLVK